MPEPEQQRLFEFKGSDLSFLKEVGIRPCVIRCRRPRPLPPSFPAIAPACLTEKEIEWLRECGVAWERKQAIQIPLDFSGCREDEQDPKAAASQTKEESA
jgi:hypothetical protein